MERSETMKERIKVVAKCDRCGKLMEKHDRYHYRILKINAHTTTHSPYYEEKYTNWSAIKHKMELCPECIDSFKHEYIQWLSDGKKE